MTKSKKPAEKRLCPCCSKLKEFYATGGYCKDCTKKRSKKRKRAHKPVTYVMTVTLGGIKLVAVRIGTTRQLVRELVTCVKPPFQARVDHVFLGKCVKSLHARAGSLHHVGEGWFTDKAWPNLADVPGSITFREWSKKL